MSRQRGPSLPEQGSETPNRLDSWKEIAAYFDRDVRTVRRWEADQGLPVHRHIHLKRGRVYAFRQELDIWLKSRAGELPRPAPRASRTPSFVALGTLLALAAVATLGVNPTTPTAEHSRDFLKALPLTTYPGIEEFPSFSPDGNEVAFSWNGPQQDNFDIYVKAVGSEDLRRLTTDPRPDYNPVWSPDGESIAWVREVKPGGITVLLVPAAGGQETRIADSLTHWTDRYRRLASFLVWTPDSRQLIFPRQNNPHEAAALVAVSVDQPAETRRLTNPPEGIWGDASPAVSSDGRRLAFSRYRSAGSGELFSQNLTKEMLPSGTPQRLVMHEAWFSGLFFVPGSRDIAFVEGPAGLAGVARGLWRMNALPSSSRRLVHLPTEEVHLPTISSGGRSLAYVHRTFNINIWDHKLPKADNRQPTARQLISSTRTDHQAHLSPDGTQVAFYSSRSGHPEIWVCDRDGSGAKQLTSFEGPLAATPRWSPDGKRIAFSAWVHGQADVYVIDRAGSAPERVTSNKANDLFPTWSRDGKWIYFGSGRADGVQVFRIPSSGQGSPTQVTRNGGWMLVEAVDGSLRYVTKKTDRIELWQLDPEGGPEVRIADSLYFPAAFDVSSRGIHYIAQGTEGEAEVRFFDFATQRTEAVTKIERPIYSNLSMSPDGRSILYSQIDDLQSDLMLVKDFQ